VARADAEKLTRFVALGVTVAFMLEIEGFAGFYHAAIEEIIPTLRCICIFRLVNDLLPPMNSGENLKSGGIDGEGPPGQYDARGAYYWGIWGGAVFNTYWPPNTQTPDRLDEAKLCYDTPETPCINSGDMTNYTRSRHQGGVFTMMADGSVRFVGNEIDRLTFQALGSRNGAEIVGEF